MTIPEMVRFFDEQAQENSRWVASHAQAGNLPMVEVNQTFYLSNMLTSALVQWRARLGSPSETMAQLVEGTSGFLAVLERLSPNNPAWKRFCFEVVDYAKILLGASVDADALRSCLPESMPSDRELGSHSLGERLPDMAVILRLVTGEKWPLWDALIEKRSSRKMLRLWSENYRAYWDLIGKAEVKDVAAVGETALRISEMFDRRERNPYYANGLPYEGGGPHNDIVVDFRLAAILRHCGHRGIEPPLPEGFAHRWPKA